MPDTIVIYRSGASESQETALMEPRECHGHGEYGEEFENKLKGQLFLLTKAEAI